MERLRRQSLPDLVAESLRQSIIGGSLAPGARLVESDLARQLGVSRGALREALRSLREEGLVRANHNRGTWVASITAADLEEIYSLRGLLEVYAVARVAERIGEAEAASLRALADALMRAAEAGDYRRAAEVDFRLHQTIWEMSGHRRLLQILAGMDSQIRLFLTVNAQLLEHLVEDASAHGEIVAAICAGQSEAAAERMRAHIELAAETMRRSLRQTSLPEGGDRRPGTQVDTGASPRIFEEGIASDYGD